MTSKQPPARDTTAHTVTLPRCRECGGREFALRFTQGKLRYRIVADCTICGAGRVVSLDQAHKAQCHGRRRGRSRGKRGRRANGKAGGPAPRRARGALRPAIPAGLTGGSALAGGGSTPAQARKGTPLPLVSP